MNEDLDRLKELSGMNESSFATKGKFKTTYHGSESINDLAKQMRLIEASIKSAQQAMAARDGDAFSQYWANVTKQVEHVDAIISGRWNPIPDADQRMER